SEAFTSLRRRSTSRPDRDRMGRDLRREGPRRPRGGGGGGGGRPPPRGGGRGRGRGARPDPVRLIIESHRGRLDWLAPVRVGRMAATPYGFLRGAAGGVAAGGGRLSCHRNN